jgi:hypothetical protein
MSTLSSAPVSYDEVGNANAMVDDEFVDPAASTMHDMAERNYAELAQANERRVEVHNRRTGYSRLSSADEFRTAFAAFRSTMNADVSAIADAADLACADVHVEHPANVIERAIRDELSEYTEALAVIAANPGAVRDKPLSIGFSLLPDFGAHVPSAADLEAPLAALRVQRAAALRDKRLAPTSNAVTPATLSRLSLAAAALPIGVIHARPPPTSVPPPLSVAAVARVCLLVVLSPQAARRAAAGRCAPDKSKGRY